MITATQVLLVVNTTNAFGQPGQTITVMWPPFPNRTVPVGKSTLFDRPFGEYLAAGVHTVRTTMYGGSGPELWLKAR